MRNIMPIPSLSEILNKAQAGRYALGHFNISNLETLRAIFETSQKLRAPVMIGTSEGERNFIGLRQAVALVRSLREEHNFPIYLNADHSKTEETALAALDAGYDSIHFDGSAMPFEENVRHAKKVVEAVRAKDPSISVEGELGYLRGDSKIIKEKIAVSPKDYTDPEQAAQFVKETGVDRLAIVVGNIHGISLDEPDLDIDRIKKIRAVIPSNVSLVLHAGSGIPDDQIRAAIDAGIVNIHINTEIRVAYSTALRTYVVEHPDETTPYKLTSSAISAVDEIIAKKIKLFGSANQA